jgi:PTS system nitrogen regulatory IIA component
LKLTVRDVSKFLSVSESTVTRWIKQRGLPARHVGGQYRFHRADLLEWATSNRVRVSADLIDHLNTEHEPSPSLAEALEAGGVFYQLEDGSKELALRAMVRVLPLPDGTDREWLLRLFLAREASASTATGNGIAIPHVRNPIVLPVDRPMVTLCFLAHPIEYGALDGKPVDVLFAIVSPTNRTHLQLLSRLSFALHDGVFGNTVTRHAPRDEILRELRRVEAGIDASAGEPRKAAP